jgi:hypothetical protein
MPLFLIFAIAFSYLVQTENYLLPVLVSSVVIYLSISVALIVIAGIIFKKIPEKYGYDFFAISVLILWYAYWRPEFGDDSPIFFVFPLYFVFMIGFVSLFFIAQRNKIDVASFRYMKKIEKHPLFKPWIIMLGILASLDVIEHYLLFPILMTLLIVRFALSGCLKSD